MDTNIGRRKGETKKLLIAGTGFDHEHLFHVAHPIPLPSMRLATRSRKAFTQQSGGLFSCAPALTALTSAKRPFVDCVFPVDLALDRIGNRDHPLVVFENPADLGAL